MASEMLMHITGRGTPMMPVERHASILAANDEAHALSMAAKDEAHASDLVVAHKVIGHCVVARARGEGGMCSHCTMVHRLRYLCPIPPMCACRKATLPELSGQGGGLIARFKPLRSCPRRIGPSPRLPVHICHRC